MRVLQLAPRVCWPLDTGARLRNYHLARKLAEQAQVTLVAFADQKQSLPQPEEIYEQVIGVSRDRDYTFSKIIRGALGPTPLPVLNYSTASMRRKLKQTLSESKFDIVQVESIHLMAYVPILREARPRPLLVCDWHNIESELMRQYSEHESNPMRRAYARKTARLMSEFEKRALREFDAHVVVSEPDAQRLGTLNPRAKVFVIENGVDTAYYAEDQIGKSDALNHDGQRIIFVGSMDYHANVDAVGNFARDVWPRVRAHNPQLVFTIVGRDPAPGIRELTKIPGVEITGTVDDVRPYYREAALAIVPLSVGGGSRLKILEAMAAGVPVVSTTLGAEGLAVRDGENILIADTAEKFVESIIQLVEHKERRAELASAARELVLERYDWSSLGASLFKIYRQLLGTLFPASAV